VQDEIHAILEPTHVGRLVGWKIGATTRVMQDYLGIPNPCAGGIFAGVVHRSGARLRFDDYRRIGVECEIAVRLGVAIGPDDAPFTAEQMRAAVDACMASIELVDDRYVDWRNTDTATLIADDFFAAGVVLGDPVPAPVAGDPVELSGVMSVNGVEVGRGRGGDVLGTPLNALAWLAAHLVTRGRSLRAGEIVSTGSLVETQWLTRGDRVRIEVTRLGSVEFTVT
jgi:2-oxo-3-hexenedioate decarboxylase/2-keto-4-pentenoate hydratase